MLSYGRWIGLLQVFPKSIHFCGWFSQHVVSLSSSRDCISWTKSPHGTWRGTWRGTLKGTWIGWGLLWVPLLMNADFTSPHWGKSNAAMNGCAHAVQHYSYYSSSYYSWKQRFHYLNNEQITLKLNQLWMCTHSRQWREEAHQIKVNYLSLHTHTCNSCYLFIQVLQNYGFCGNVVCMMGSDSIPFHCRQDWIALPPPSWSCKQMREGVSLWVIQCTDIVPRVNEWVSEQTALVCLFVCMFVLFLFYILIDMRCLPWLLVFLSEPLPVPFSSKHNHGKAGEEKAKSYGKGEPNVVGLLKTNPQVKGAGNNKIIKK